MTDPEFTSKLSSESSSESSPKSSPKSSSKLTLLTLIVAPICIMGVFTALFLLPALKNPESKVYSSSIGYPALKRLLGQPIKVQSVAATQQSFQESVAAPGESVALQAVSVSSLVNGTVEEVFVAEGDIVQKGQPLMRIVQAPFQDSVVTARANVGIAESTLRGVQTSDPATLTLLEANLKSAEQRLAIVEEQFNRLKALEEEGAISAAHLYEIEDSYFQRQREFAVAQQDLARYRSEVDQALQNAQLTLENNQVALQQAMRDLNQTIVYAPNHGLVSQVIIHAGETANIQTPVITLSKDVVFKAYVDQASLDRIQVDDSAMVRLVAYPGEVFAGKVIRLNPTVNTEVAQPGTLGVNRQYTYSVWLQINDLEMPPGLQGYVAFGQEHQELAVPEDAVTHLSSGEGMVMVVQAGQAVVKQVKLGRVIDGKREVLAGLQAGEQVVLSPRALNPGDRLTIDVASSSTPDSP